ncbi:MAG: hypothetical protein COY36_02400 [Zetaproteobacteria bacterium CG_4_10_14_0_2_um_filter_55_20]|nr:MAG: hypothetical protein COT53_04710 [Zetaproteobacteria bacterium CG08_land_8_20_14_0_20_55_17]PIY51466.1 MAG: hypothetical protein COZ01_11080 [Zetaproteobacteria bacterium CG_4_10_14_0_8_um_filter_55_43]PIZ39607.1 MAG: hypothetical protein COY36_02400 [Zetaproteobacteria bacterium CG_4_10_14_0_2_um_filter_55_20]
MRFVNKRYTAAIAGCLFAIISASCGGGGGGTIVGNNGINGNGNKGPFQTGATVTAYQLDAAGARTGTTKATTVTDNLGTYSLTGITWAGATEIVITGSYLDENTGNVITGPETLSAITVLPAIGTVVNNTTTNPNIASDAVAKLAKSNMATASAAGSPVAADAAVSSANGTVLQALGFPTTDSTGAALDTSKLDLTKTGDATFGAANAQLLALSAATTLTAGTATTNAIDAFITTLITDIKAGSALGTTSGNTAALNTNITTVNTNVATIVANINTVAATPVTTAQVTTAVTSTQTNITTALKGMAIQNNAFTIGTANYTVGTTGAATMTGGANPVASNVVLGFTFKDYRNTAGTGAGAAATLSGTFGFYIASTVTGDSRKISGSLSPVTVTTDGAGAVAVAVPANAVLTFSGTNAAGVNVTGTATNIAANTIQTSASIVSINANTLLSTIQTKVGNASLNVLSTAGTFSFEFGLDLNIGHDAVGSITNYFPVGAAGAKVSGRRISGSLTTL